MAYAIKLSFRSLRQFSVNINNPVTFQQPPSSSLIKYAMFSILGITNILVCIIILGSEVMLCIRGYLASSLDSGSFNILKQKVKWCYFVHSPNLKLVNSYPLQLTAMKLVYILLLIALRIVVKKREMLVLLEQVDNTT